MSIFIFKNLISNSFTRKLSPLNLYKPHLLFSTKPNKSKPLSITEYLINRHGFSPETVAKVSTVVTCIPCPEKSDSVLNCLEKNSFSNTHVEKIIKSCPKILSADVDKTIKPKIKIFMDLGFTQDEVAEIFSKNPWLLKRSAKQTLPSITQLKKIVGTNAGICKVLKGCAWFLHHDLEKTMLPNIEFLRSRGVGETQITQTLFTFPRLFTVKSETMKALVERVDELGVDRDSKMYVRAIRTLASMTNENWELKLKVFRSLGWSENDILFVFRSKPVVFTSSAKRIREVQEFISSRGKCDASFLLLHPEILTYSLEGRVKPRFQIVEILKSKNLISERISLASICKLSDARFLKRYVLPYELEVGNLYKYPASSQILLRGIW